MLPKEKKYFDLKMGQLDGVGIGGGLGLEVTLEIIRILDMADAGRRELEGSDGGTIVQVVRINGEQVLEGVALDAAGLLAAVGHQTA